MLKHVVPKQVDRELKDKVAVDFSTKVNDFGRMPFFCQIQKVTTSAHIPLPFLTSLVQFVVHTSESTIKREPTTLDEHLIPSLCLP